MLTFYKELVSSTQPTLHRQPNNWFYKRSREHFPVQIDYSNVIPAGGSISSGSVVCYDNAGASVAGIATFDEIVGTDKTQIIVADGKLSASWYNIYCRGIVEVSGDPDSEYEVLVRMNVLDEPLSESTFLDDDAFLDDDDFIDG